MEAGESRETSVAGFPTFPSSCSGTSTSVFPKKPGLFLFSLYLQALPVFISR